jgi:hypothetical protein
LLPNYLNPNSQDSRINSSYAIGESIKSLFVNPEMSYILTIRHKKGSLFQGHLYNFNDYGKPIQYSYHWNGFSFMMSNKFGDSICLTPSYDTGPDFYYDVSISILDISNYGSFLTFLINLLYPERTLSTLVLRFLLEPEAGGHAGIKLFFNIHRIGFGIIKSVDDKNKYGGYISYYVAKPDAELLSGITLYYFPTHDAIYGHLMIIGGKISSAVIQYFYKDKLSEFRLALVGNVLLLFQIPEEYQANLVITLEKQKQIIGLILVFMDIILIIGYDLKSGYFFLTLGFSLSLQITKDHFSLLKNQYILNP